MISKSGVRSEAALTARITMLAMVPLSLYAGKKTLRPAGLPSGQVGQVRQVGKVGQVGQVGRVGQVPRVGPPYLPHPPYLPCRVRVATSRHGVSIDSTSTPAESFDWPTRRSTNVIGTSAVRQPWEAATCNISTRNE